MDAQEEHDYLLARRKAALAEEGKTLGGGSRARLKSALKKKGGVVLTEQGGDPIREAIANNPGLTSEKASEIAEKFGF